MNNRQDRTVIILRKRKKKNEESYDCPDFSLWTHCQESGAGRRFTARTVKSLSPRDKVWSSGRWRQLGSMWQRTSSRYVHRVPLESIASIILRAKYEILLCQAKNDGETADWKTPKSLHRTSSGHSGETPGGSHLLLR